MSDHKDLMPDTAVNGAVKNVEEIIFALFLVAEKCKERFGDGVQWTDFFSLGKFLMLDSEFKTAMHAAIADLTLMKPMLLRLNFLDLMVLWAYCKKIMARLEAK